MRVDLFDFDLPEERIALRPAEPRDTARLLLVHPGEPLEDKRIGDLPSLLQPGDVMVFNDTKVIPAQLKGVRQRGEAVAHVDATLHMRVGPDRWYAFVRPGKRVAEGDRIRFGHDAEACMLGALDATVVEKGEGGEVLLAFDVSDRCSTRRCTLSVISRCRPTLPQSAPTTSATARTTRPSTRGKRARSPRPQPDCILRRICLQRSMHAASSGTA